MHCGVGGHCGGGGNVHCGDGGTVHCTKYNTYRIEPALRAGRYRRDLCIPLCPVIRLTKGGSPHGECPPY